MKLLVIGSGGREHAIVRALKKSPRVAEIHVLPGNGGISEDAICADIAATDIDGAVAYAKDHGIDYAVVTPDDPLCLGMVDAMEAEGIPCFGPEKRAAMIEGSKVFAKGLMKKYGIPTAVIWTAALIGELLSLGLGLFLLRRNEAAAKKELDT